MRPVTKSSRHYLGKELFLRLKPSKKEVLFCNKEYSSRTWSACKSRSSLKDLSCCATEIGGSTETATSSAPAAFANAHKILCFRSFLRKLCRLKYQQKKKNTHNTMQEAIEKTEAFNIVGCKGHAFNLFEYYSINFSYVLGL